MLAAPALLAAATVATCNTPDPVDKAIPPDPARDVMIGPLGMMTRERLAGKREAYLGRGWKTPVLLPDGMTVTLSVAPWLRGKVGLSYTHAVEQRIWDGGPAAGSTRIEFRACPRAPGRTTSGFPGGIMVDRPRCATFFLRVKGERRTHRVRVALGRACS